MKQKDQMRIAPKTLKGSLLLAVASLVVISSLLVAILASQRYAEALGSSLKARAENQAHSLSLHIANSILINDLVGLHKALNNHRRSNPVVEYIFVVRQGQLLAHTFDKGFPRELLKVNSPSPQNGFSLVQVESESGHKNLLDIAWPIFEGKAGTLRMGFKRDVLLAEMHRLWLEVGLVTLIILLPAVAGGLLFMRRITRPMESLVEATRNMAKGFLDVRVDVRGKDEFASLAESFNTMAARLEDNTRRLQHQAENLEQMHSQLSTAYEVIHSVSAQTQLDSAARCLVGKLGEILTCEQMVLLLYSQDRSRLYRLSGSGSEIIQDQKLLRDVESTLSALPPLSMHKSRDLFRLPLVDETFAESFSQTVIPLDSHKNLFGALVVACPGDCGCDFTEVDLVALIIAHTADSIFRAAAQEEEMLDLRSRLEGNPVYGNIVGRDPEMQKIFNLIDEVAPTTASVLIYGESGTGKELVARAIHEKSPRKDKPFVIIDCTAFPSTLIERELFGHEKGAFTGADAARPGRFEKAEGGTVFLDEISEIPPEAQVKLLRVLQTQKFERLGGSRTISVNMRIIAATNKDLLEEVRAGRFREDLYYRLEVVPIQLPPLRSRGNDITLLARHFAARFSAREGKQIRDISPHAMRLLLRYPWPGNIRELENVMEQSTIMARGDSLKPSDLPDKLHEQWKNPTNEKTMRSHERDLLLQKLEECAWNKKLTAEKLGIGRSTLYSKMKKFKIDQEA
ncbi:MAG: sigma 54-interacting transcriptional regulator [Desulfohalobiaceae bacterium]|nr:sigma 54-interacting transcriptional regulator [Desulfohalobiaceae bacterium]